MRGMPRSIIVRRASSAVRLMTASKPSDRAASLYDAATARSAAAIRP